MYKEVVVVYYCSTSLWTLLHDMHICLIEYYYYCYSKNSMCNCIRLWFHDMLMILCILLCSGELSWEYKLCWKLVFIVGEEYINILKFSLLWNWQQIFPCNLRTGIFGNWKIYIYISCVQQWTFFLVFFIYIYFVKQCTLVYILDKDVSIPEKAITSSSWIHSQDFFLVAFCCAVVYLLNTFWTWLY